MVHDPIVNLRVFKDKNLALGSLQIAIMGFVLYASAVLIPQYAQQQLAYNATGAGLVLAPGAIVLVMLIPVAGKIMNVVPAKYVIASGGLALGLALIYSMNLVPDLDFWHLVWFRAAQTAALALLFVPISHRLCHGPAGVERRRHRVVQYGAKRVWRHRHFCLDRVGDRAPADPPGARDRHAGPRQPALQCPAAAGTARAAGRRALDGAGDANGAGAIFQMLQKQVAVLAYNDVFLITACLPFVMIPTALLMSGIKPESGGGGH